jgi:hypothetical protein
MTDAEIKTVRYVFELGFKLERLEKQVGALDKLVRQMIMGDIDPEQAMIARAKINEEAKDGQS